VPQGENVEAGIKVKGKTPTLSKSREEWGTPKAWKRGAEATSEAKSKA